MKKSLRSFISLTVALVTLLSVGISVYANDVKPEYTDQEIEDMWEEASSQPVLPDKNNGSQIATRAFGTYPTRKGVILVTPDKYKNLIPTGHAAIVYTSSTVVESIDTGVTTGANNWNSTKSGCYGVTVSGTTTAQDAQAADWCYSQRGKPYNWNYIDRWTRSSFYCSQLVYASFLDNFGIDLDTAAWLSAVHPMELVNSGNTYTVYEK